MSYHAFDAKSHLNTDSDRDFDTGPDKKRLFTLLNGRPQGGDLFPGQMPPCAGAVGPSEF
jgi:hypothetical protein